MFNILFTFIIQQGGHELLIVIRLYVHFRLRVVNAEITKILEKIFMHFSYTKMKPTLPIE